MRPNNPSRAGGRGARLTGANAGTRRSVQCRRNPSSYGLNTRGKRRQGNNGSGRSPIEPITATLPEVEIARVKPVDLSSVDFRLSEGLIDLMSGFSLGSFHGIGGAWETPSYIAIPGDGFEARFGQW
jgi:hypothetical protein